MLDGLKIALTAVFGIGVFVIGQLLQRIFIEPIQQMRLTVAKVAHALTYYANFIPLTPLAFAEGVTVGRPPDQMKDASDEIRKLASNLRAIPSIIPAYGMFAKMKLVPSREAVKAASTGLIGWANSLGTDGSGTHRKAIVDALGFPPELAG